MIGVTTFLLFAFLPTWHLICLHTCDANFPGVISNSVLGNPELLSRRRPVFKTIWCVFKENKNRVSEVFTWWWSQAKVPNRRGFFERCAVEEGSLLSFGDRQLFANICDFSSAARGKRQTPWQGIVSTKLWGNLDPGHVLPSLSSSMHRKSALAEVIAGRKLPFSPRRVTWPAPSGVCWCH